MKADSKIRIRVFDLHQNVGYLTVYDGEVHYNAKDGIPASLSSIATDAMALRFALEDARTGEEAVKAVKVFSRGLSKIELMKGGRSTETTAFIG